MIEDDSKTKHAPLLQPTANETEDAVFASLDFAHFVVGRLLLYGWVLGLASQVDSISLRIGKVELDVTGSIRTLSRPDVSMHFGVEDAEHGFYALVTLPEVPTTDEFLLVVSLRSGRKQESQWNFQGHEDSSSLPQDHRETLHTLLPSLPPLDRLRLDRLLDNGVDDAGLSTELRSPTQVGLEACCVIDRRILVVAGWMLDSTLNIAAVHLAVGDEVHDLMTNRVPYSRPGDDVGRNDSSPSASSSHTGFFFVQTVPPAALDSDEAVFVFTLQDEKTTYLVRPLCRNPHEARGQLLSLLGGMGLEPGLLMLEKIFSATQALPGMQPLQGLLQLSHDFAVERLATSIQDSSQGNRYWLHLDQCVVAADEGLFLSGWCYSENDKRLDVTYHCGQLSFPVDANWVRHTRADVTTYLKGEGAYTPDDEHGFTCYIPLKTGTCRPWISARTASGDGSRMTLPRAQHEKSTLKTIQNILATFHGDHRELRVLMDRQVGPAVKAVWSQRRKSSVVGSIEIFGTKPGSPAASIVVALYGRWDFAQYQLSLFANDSDFQKVDLIYVVDDPTIYDAFRQAAPLLYGVFSIPFTLAFSGTNLGFAGANNFGAAQAKSDYLLLLNSDVLPKRAGWLSEMLRLHKALDAPGLLGAKLLYEDGTLQHAGMAFRRYAAWGGMWINDHPYKGQMRSDLKGVHELSAVTAACVLMQTDLFRELGGLSEDYIIGDFEDSDLCLRAKQAGRKNYVALDVELYHLERQSQAQTGDAIWRANLTAYNCWLHDKRWSAQIEKLAGDAI